MVGTHKNCELKIGVTPSRLRAYDKHCYALGMIATTTNAASFFSIFEIMAILITLSAIFGWINKRVFRLPVTIGLMAMSLGLSLLLVLLGLAFPPVLEEARAFLASIDFDETLLHGMLGFLLFAGALHVNLSDLASQKWVITLLSTVGVLISTALIGIGSWFVLGIFGFELRFIYCLLFGALISPTDPIAVLAILKTLTVPKSLETKIAGESLFNDGVGVVVFLVIFGAAGIDGGHGDGGTSLLFIIRLFSQEALGGALLGLILGYIGFVMLRAIDEYAVEILTTLAVVAGGYALADRIHVSGPIAMVVAGLLIGNHGRALAMSATTRRHLDMFWELIDEILNAVLFVLIGLEVMALSHERYYTRASLVIILLVLASRFISVVVPISLLRIRRTFTPHVVKVLTWGGLRGGISVALALSIPRSAHGVLIPEREVILVITYAVVVFSIIVQGLTISHLIDRWHPPER